MDLCEFEVSLFYIEFQARQSYTVRPCPKTEQNTPSPPKSNNSHTTKPNNEYPSLLGQISDPSSISSRTLSTCSNCNCFSRFARCLYNSIVCVSFPCPSVFRFQFPWVKSLHLCFLDYYWDSDGSVWKRDNRRSIILSWTQSYRSRSLVFSVTRNSFWKQSIVLETSLWFFSLAF